MDTNRKFRIIDRFYAGEFRELCVVVAECRFFTAEIELAGAHRYSVSVTDASRLSDAQVRRREYPPEIHQQFHATLESARADAHRFSLQCDTNE